MICRMFKIIMVLALLSVVLSEKLVQKESTLIANQMDEQWWSFVKKFVRVAIKVAPLVIKAGDIIANARAQGGSGATSLGKRGSAKAAKAKAAGGKLMKKIPSEHVKKIMKHAKKGRKFIQKKDDQGAPAWYEEVEDDEDPCRCWANSPASERLCEVQVARDQERCGDERACHWGPAELEECQAGVEQEMEDVHEAGDCYEWNGKLWEGDAP